MNKQQYEVEKEKIAREKAVINRLKRQYSSAEKQISEKIKTLQKQIEALTEKMLNADPQEALIIKSQIMAKVYQKDYQENLRNQISKSVDAMNDTKNRIVDDYLNECYTTGFTGSMYDMHNQGIPVMAPINPQEVEKALKLNAKVSQRLYRGYTNLMKRQMQSEISRGLLQGASYAEMARNLHNTTNASFNNTMRIVRTEGHRIQVQSAVDACHKAKEAGADVLKQWDATLDGATRDTHRELSGKIAELDEDFEYSGGSVSAPGMFGDPAEDCNCRCCILQRARWALDESELKELESRAAYYGLDKVEDFNEYKEKYLGVVKTNSSDIINNITIDELTPCLRRLKDGKIVDTMVYQISPTEEAFKDWEFDWTIPEKNGYDVFELIAERDRRTQGLIALKPDKSSCAMHVDVAEAAPHNNPHNRLCTSKEYNGVGGHLFAEAVKQSYENGFDGVVFFTAKTDLIEHYKKELGAELINPRQRVMCINERAAKKLFERYYGGDKWN